MLKRVTIWLRATLAKPAAERDLDDEIRLHLDLETEKKRAGRRALRLAASRPRRRRIAKRAG
jgi:hypothetical protein